MTDCIIHIGMHKTGSTSIQQSLCGFSDNKFLYADLEEGKSNHSLAMYSLFMARPEKHFLHRYMGRNEAAIQNFISEKQKRLEDVIHAADGRTLIISGEDIQNFSQEALYKMQQYFQSRVDNLSIVGYVRSPAEFVTSGFQERIKNRMARILNLDQEYRSYEKTFGNFDEIFGRENVQLWKFEPKNFPGSCVVQDFCSRLNISLSPEKVIRQNESLSKQATLLLYIYYKYGIDLGANMMTPEDNNRLSHAISSIGKDKFRFSPDLLRPLLEKNRLDIEWMERRLGQSLFEGLGEHRPGDIRDESDLLTVEPAVLDKLLKLLGDQAPADVTGRTPAEVTLLVHALNGKINPTFKHYLETSRITHSVGHLDVANKDYCSGWVYYPFQPNRQANVQIYINSQHLYTVEAKLPRLDVKEKKAHPTGLCGFKFEWPEDDLPKEGDRIEIRVEDDVKFLGGSPKFI